MPLFRQPDISCHCTCKQHGAALMVMLVIMIIGAAAILVGSLGSSTLQIERDKITATALAQAKEALIGYAASDSNHPGSLPCPDVNDDGKLTMNVDYVGSNCVSLIGRLPWKTLRLSELRDGAVEHLWYAVSKPFAAVGTPHINSDIQGTLSISGTNSASNVIAIVFAPGAVMNGTSRSPSLTAACSTSGTTVAQSLCATNYLEGNNAALSTWTTPNLNYQSADTCITFNDRMIFITHQNLMPLIEKRIAREVKNCLDSYASSNAGQYPWAAPVSDTTYTGTMDTLFGRLPTFSGCTLFSSSYWLDDWRNLVFYQIADGYKPGGSGSCGTTCLAITGSGNTVEGSGTYRAVVAVAGKMKPGQTSRNATLVSDYLELLNQSGKTDLPTSTSFETYKTFDAQYPMVNDLVLCLDGRNNCK